MRGFFVFTILKDSLICGLRVAIMVNDCPYYPPFPFLVSLKKPHLDMFAICEL